jgi:hypothetical protein
LARDGDPEPIHIKDTKYNTNFAVEWKGQYHIEGRTFVYIDGQSGRVTAISGYPTAKLAQLGQCIFGNLPRLARPSMATRAGLAKAA